MHPIVKLLDQPTLRIVGLMSGTSLDGIDAALVEIDREPFAVRLRAFETRAYTDEERQRIAGLLGTNTATLCQGNFWLGELFAAAATSVLAKAKVAPAAIDLVGSHGQTVWHQPPSRSREGQTPSTLQLGEPAVIAARLGCVTVGDFRVADVAVGGEGAPLVPFLDALLYGHSERRRALLNLGGIGNVTFLLPGQAPVAFDSGPGNMVIDALVTSLTGGRARFDRDGQWAATGRVDEALLAELLAEDADYLGAPPPKSTGRERYGSQFSEQLLARSAALGQRDEDLLRTAVAFTAQTVARALSFAAGPIEEVLVSGGGVHNRTLLGELARRCPGASFRSLGDEGLDPDAKEAVAFAVLAAHTLWGKPSNLPTVTGARRAAILGKLCLP